MGKLLEDKLENTWQCPRCHHDLHYIYDIAEVIPCPYCGWDELDKQNPEGAPELLRITIS